MLRLELDTDSKKNKSEMGNDGVESIYWAGTETELLRILEFPGIIYATDGSKDNNGVGARFYRDRYDTRGDGCCKVGRAEEGLFSNRPEYVAVWLALLDTQNRLTRDNINGFPRSPYLYSELDCGRYRPHTSEIPSGEILRAILELLRIRMNKGIFTLFIKIKAH